MSDERFCGRCEVVRELHPDPSNDDPYPWECDVAERKADMMDRFFGNFVR